MIHRHWNREGHMFTHEQTYLFTDALFLIDRDAQHHLCIESATLQRIMS